jgi:hypothetical protein
VICVFEDSFLIEPSLVTSLQKKRGVYRLSVSQILSHVVEIFVTSLVVLNPNTILVSSTIKAPMCAQIYFSSGMTCLCLSSGTTWFCF